MCSLNHFPHKFTNEIHLINMITGDEWITAFTAPSVLLTMKYLGCTIWANLKICILEESSHKWPQSEKHFPSIFRSGNSCLLRQQTAQDYFQYCLKIHYFKLHYNEKWYSYIAPFSYSWSSIYVYVSIQHCYENPKLIAQNCRFEIGLQIQIH